jgi:hypothetical protein
MLKKLLIYYHVINTNDYNELLNEELVSKHYDIFKTPKNYKKEATINYDDLIKSDQIKDILSSDIHDIYRPGNNKSLSNILLRIRLSIHQNGFKGMIQKIKSSV